MDDVAVLNCDNNKATWIILKQNVFLYASKLNMMKSKKHKGLSSKFTHLYMLQPVKENTDKTPDTFYQHKVILDYIYTMTVRQSVSIKLYRSRNNQEGWHCFFRWLYFELSKRVRQHNTSYKKHWNVTTFEICYSFSVKAFFSLKYKYTKINAHLDLVRNIYWTKKKIPI